MNPIAIYHGIAYSNVWPIPVADHVALDLGLRAGCRLPDGFSGFVSECNGGTCREPAMFEYRCGKNGASERDGIRHVLDFAPENARLTMPVHRVVCCILNGSLTRKLEYIPFAVTEAGRIVCFWAPNCSIVLYDPETRSAAMVSNDFDGFLDMLSQ